ncbi:hypothetical protein OH807_07630 [Kitasatospora sp. NBC_01560]|uniref:hypothetical protein n=1 Tax=Kitasatospora sp. NBC_01560 TaxID=2975965 RepID=UPI0038694C51
MVTATGVEDSAGGRQVLDVLADRWPSVTEAWVDTGCNQAVVRHGAALPIDVEVVARGNEQKGFVVQPVRGRVERTFGSMSRYRRLHRDYEELPDRSRSIHWATVNSMTTRLTASPDSIGQYLRPKPPAAAWNSIEHPLTVFMVIR